MEDYKKEAEKNIDKRIEKLKKNLIDDLNKKGNEDLIINFGGVRVSKESFELKEKTQLLLGECYEEIILFLKDYIDMREENYPIVALWIMGTYFHREFNTYPYLFVNAMRGSGKTRLLNIIKELAWNGEVLTSVREASLFRSAGNNTICIDEFEGIMKKENAGLREILNASYKKGMKIKRMKKTKNNAGEDYIVEEFEPYTPIVMANIWGVEEVLGDRCIKILLEKSEKEHLIYKMEDFIDNPVIKSIKNKLNRCSLCSVVSPQNINKKWNQFIGDIYINTTLTTLNTQNTQINTQNVENFSVVRCSFEKLNYEKELDFFKKLHQNKIGGRYLELTMPLFILSEAFSKTVLDEILKITKKFFEENKTEERTESKDVMLFQFVAMQNSFGEFVNIIDLLNDFKNYVHDDEKDFQWLNSKWLGRALKRLNLVLDKRRVHNGIQVILDIQKAKQKIEIFK